MELEELLTRLDLDKPADFEYFEHFAELVECEESISYEAFHNLLTQVEPSVVGELIENYFEEVAENLPDNTTDIYTLLLSIRQTLLGLAEHCQEEDDLRKFVDELYKFHNWYALDGEVQCRRLKDNVTISTTIAEALALCRLEKLGEDSYQYDFDQCMDYELDEYTMTFSLNRNDQLEHVHSGHAHEDDCGCGHGLDDDHDPLAEHAYQRGLVDRSNPVIDGEFSDDESDNGYLM